MTQDVCSTGASLGVQTFGFGVSGGKHFIDKNCERLKLARILNDFGMRVAAVAILCQDERVFESMISAGTVCPIDGKIGAEAMALWAKYGHERPDYNTYMKRVKDREKADKKAEKLRIKEEKKMTKELEKMGYSIAAYPLTILSAAMKATKTVLENFKNNINSENMLMPFKEMQKVIGFDDYFKLEKKYVNAKDNDQE
jgi:hypothetical protein